MFGGKTRKRTRHAKKHHAKKHHVKKHHAKKTAKKSRKASRKRAPSKYQRFMKTELARLRKQHPSTAMKQLFKQAAKGWSAHKK